MLIKSEQLSVGSLIKNVMLKYLFWASYILRLCAQTCTPNRHALILITLEVSYVSLDTAALIYPVFNKSIKSDEKRHFMSMKTYVLWNYTMHRRINLPHDDNLCNCQHKSRRIGQF